MERSTDKSPIELTQAARLAADYVNSTNANIFLTGKAGTGKTTFLRTLVQSTHKKHLIVAPTGIAALNAKGVTIHSQFLFPFGALVPERELPIGTSGGAFHDRRALASRHSLDGRRRKLLRQCELLIIDEVSMLRADILDAIDYRLRSAKGRYKEAFGGAQVLFIGDLFQLAPIVKDHEWMVLRNYYSSIHFFEALALKQAPFVQIELDKVFRQRDDTFVALLNNLRENKLTISDVKVLNARHVSKHEIPDGTIALTTHNQQANARNERELKALATKELRYEAEIEGDFPEHMYPVLETMILKEGAQVMFTRNDSQEKRYFNGKLAKVISLSKEEIVVRLSGSQEEITVRKEEWRNIKYEMDDASNSVNEIPIGTFMQYPLRLAWAITVHKSQGLTFERAIVDVGNAFAPGQVYVALSRLTSLEGLYMNSLIRTDAVMNDEQVLQFADSADSQEELRSSLSDHRRKYLEDRLKRTFDFAELTEHAAYVQNKFNAKMEFADEQMNRALPELIEKFKTEVRNSNVFIQQLRRLLTEDDNDALRARVQKGGAYYSKLLFEAYRSGFQHLEEVSQFSRVKRYEGALEELNGMIVLHLERIQHLPDFIDALLAGKQFARREKLDKERLKELEAIRDAVESFVAEHRQLNVGKSGRKRKRKSSSSPAEPKVSTHEVTFELYQNGKDISAIAKERGLKETTIEGHIAKNIGEGKITIDAVLDEPVRKELEALFAKHPKGGRKEIFAAAKGKYSYSILQMMQEHRQWIASTESD